MLKVPGDISTSTLLPRQCRVPRHTKSPPYSPPCHPRARLAGLDGTRTLLSAGAVPIPTWGQAALAYVCQSLPG